MVNLNLPPWAYGVAGLGALWFLMRPREIVSGAVSTVGEVTAGVVEGTTDVFQNVTQSALGIPKTNVERCRDARARGDFLDTMTYCALIDDLVFDSNKTKPATYTPSPANPAKPVTPITLPGGGFYESFGGPSFNDILNDPYGIGTQAPNYFIFDNTPMNAPSRSQDVPQPKLITPVSGLRG